MNTTPPRPITTIIYFATPVFALLIVPVFIGVTYMVSGKHGMIFFSIYLVILALIIVMMWGARNFAVNFYLLIFTLGAVSAASAALMYLTIWFHLFPLWVALLASLVSVVLLIWFGARKWMQVRTDDIQAKRLVDRRNGVFDVVKASEDGLDYRPAKQPERRRVGMSGCGGTVAAYLIPSVVGLSFALGRLGIEDARLLIMSISAYAFVFVSLYNWHIAGKDGCCAAALGIS